MDPIDAVAHPDPYPAYDALAATRGLVRCPARGFWIAAHPETVREVLASDACAVRPAGEPVPPALAGTPAGAVFAQLVRMREDPARVPLRDLVTRVLTALPDEVVAREASHAARRLAAEGASAWHVAHLAAPYTLGRLFAVDDAALPELARAAVRFAARLAPGAAAEDDEEQVHSANAVARLSALLAPTFSPELVANAIGFFFQAQDSCAGLIGNTLVAISRDATFRADASERRVRGLVEHVAASDPSIHNTRRFVIREAALGGQRLEAGDVVLVVLAAAARAKAPELAFGYGRHACPGRQLAVILATAAILVVLEGGRAALPAPPIRYRASPNARIPFSHD